METKTSLSVSESTAEIVAIYKQFGKLCDDIYNWYEKHFVGKSESESAKRSNGEILDAFSDKMFTAADSFSDFLKEQIDFSVHEQLGWKENCI